MKPIYFFRTLCIYALLIGVAPFLDAAGAQEPATPKAVTALLSSAVMCEAVRDNAPVSPTIVFSVHNGSAFCWSDFDPVTVKNVIYHFWYRKDKLVASVKLLLQPPRWSTYSSIRLRDSDKGPWRVEIVDSGNTILKTLRFSISD